MARPKKAKQRSEPASAAVALDEIESAGDRLATWLSENPFPVLGVALAVLLMGGGFALVQSSLESGRVEASAALAQAQRDFRVAMGASPDDVQVQEPANVETGRRVRAEFLERFREVAEAHPSQAAGSLAWLEVGALQQALGQEDEALATWEGALADLASSDPITSLLALKVAAVYEDESRWKDAGEAFEKAALVERFPLRYGALADAARCYAEAGEVDRALAAFDRIELEAPEFFIPEHVGARLREMRAARNL